MSSRVRILVVEDVRDTADTFAVLIRLWGYEAIVAYDGARALEEASVRPPDVVFLDIGLPGMDGCEVARRLRRLPGMEEALFVAISGFGQEADVKSCEEAGIDYHFLKPVDPDQLRRLLDGSRLAVAGNEKSPA